MNKDVVFVVDENNNALAPCLRSDAIRNRLWRRAGGGIALDKQRGLVLCHRRSLEKDERPGLWVATFGGKSNPEEPPIETATRELYEEFGFGPEVEKVDFIKCIKSEERRQFEYLYIVDIDSKATKVKTDHREVAEFEWLTIADVIYKLQDSNLWYSYGYEIDLLNSTTK
jgi:8-oxo-dGTP pyrophosphatase MutT (NUDIX family)